ncbi:TlpA family protein disulfide reductase [Paludifilum halophilum]|uniref:Thioredoxin domain-containing protein n=1 Tax=Paludifilum halophilum TaxID=1642702 RepID=A0A235B714_9BACL|nr:TlpA disulfide reductase family protein [Paludifilum halophilum]OYD08098.1 hypothetical protein CHM34_08280 [Paludifilum halophilum]
MGNRLFWRNLLIAVVILGAVAGSIWASGGQNASEQKASESDRSTPAQESESQTNPQKGAKGPNRDQRAAEGFQAPDFTLKTLKGDEVTLSEAGGKPTLINLWASWCPPCKVEMPHIQEAYEKYGEQVNFRMVNLTSLDDKEKMKQYVKKEKFTFPILLDESGEVGEKYQAFSIPQTYIVNEKGEVIQKITGAMTEEQLQEIMKELTS